MKEFAIQLSYEMWNDVFIDKDVDTIFNSFANSYLRIFYSNFPKKLIKVDSKYDPWMTKSIKVCQHKRDLLTTIRKDIKSISGRNNNKADIQFLKIDCKLTDNHVIGETLNKYFLKMSV
jgi:hypothetical protein